MCVYIYIYIYDIFFLVDVINLNLLILFWMVLAFLQLAYCSDDQYDLDDVIQEAKDAAEVVIYNCYKIKIQF